MTKTWNGPTPYDEENSYTCRWALERDRHRGEGYRAAMNSPEVRTMYEALRDEQDWRGSIEKACFPRNLETPQQTDIALAAYETGLRETE